MPEVVKGDYLLVLSPSQPVSQQPIYSPGACVWAWEISKGAANFVLASECDTKKDPFIDLGTEFSVEIG